MSKLTLDTIRTAIGAMKAVGQRVHHVEIGYLAWVKLQPELMKCEMRDDVGYGSHPATLDGPARKLPVIDGAVLTPDALCVCGDQWALVFGMTGDTAVDYALTPSHRALYANAKLGDDR